jgi:putative ribosome biogenesis GTPase RsgA
VVCHGQALNDSTEYARNGGYLMINSFEITNFRCFKHLPAVALKRFNIIVGESGSGKTSLMEALFLSGGATPEIYLRLRAWRGLSSADASTC